MLTQVRIYTVNGGMMDSWVDIFNNYIAPGHARVGIKIVGAWVNKPQNEFCWVREFDSEQDMEEKMKAFQESPERKELGSRLREHLAKMEFRNCEPVFAPAPVKV